MKATDDIPDLTLICEYAGEVDFIRNRLFSKSDSIMDLVRNPNSN